MIIKNTFYLLFFTIICTGTVNITSTTENDKKNIKLLCLIHTHSANHQTKAVSLKNTWLKHCDKSIFFSNIYDNNLTSLDRKFEIFVLNKTVDTYKNLWQKTKASFEYAFDHYFTTNNYKNFDWFLKADDDTFVLVENLKMFLKKKDSNKNYYFGSKLKYQSNHLVDGYMSGGAGYILSRGSLKKLVTKGLRNKKLCSKTISKSEDVQMGLCLRRLNILPTYIDGKNDTIKFFPSKFMLLYIFNIEENNIYKILKNHTYGKLPKKGIKSMPKYPISFHYISPKNMYLLDYLFYKAKVDKNS